MSIYLGNVSIEDIEKRLGITLTDIERGWFKLHHQDNASDIQPNRWHCYDIPFDLTCGDLETAKHVAGILSPYSKKMKTSIQICVERRK